MSHGGFSSGLYAIGSAVLVSALALVGLVALRWDAQAMRQRMPMAIALAAGVLIGEAIFHLLPESCTSGLPSLHVSGLCLAGVGFSSLIEVFLRRVIGHDEIAPVARISWLAESVHNCIDGAIIAAAYITGFRVGLMATLAILLHELPHELANFAILVESGFSRSKALVLNLVSASFSIAGAVLVTLAGTSLVVGVKFVLPAAAGTFLYIALVDLIPGLWKSNPVRARGRFASAIVIGAALMLVLRQIR